MVTRPGNGANGPGPRRKGASRRIANGEGKKTRAVRITKKEAEGAGLALVAVGLAAFAVWQRDEIISFWRSTFSRS